MRIEGEIFCMPEDKFDDINTDEILSGPFMRIPEEELSAHTFEGIVENFKATVKGKNILVAGKNMGCGSSREQAPKALIGCGINTIIAESFGYIFYRNAINLGLVLIKVDRGVLKKLRIADTILIDLEENILFIDGENGGKIKPIEDVSLKILNAGGLLPYLKENDDF